MVKKGYLYVAFGDQYVQEAIQSALTIKKNSPNAVIAIITSDKITNVVFDKVLNSPPISKIEGLLRTPFERTFFIDTDTYFCESCDNGFNLLDYYEICMAQAPNELDIEFKNSNIEGYRPLNSGVILYNIKALDTLKIASDLYTAEESINPSQIRRRDQPYIALAILESRIRVHVLPSTWNFRSCFFVGLRGSVKIIHDRGRDMELIQRRVNENFGQRCWNPNSQKLIGNKLLYL
jgi:hypothetical protein